MELTTNEKSIVSWVLENVIDNANKESGEPVYNTDMDLLFSFSNKDYQALKKALMKINE